MIAQYTREAGVRNLERQIGDDRAQGGGARGHRQARRGQRRDIAGRRRRDLPDYLGPPRIHGEVAFRTSRPGVATGVAWTETGGDVLFVEATLLPGRQGQR